MYYIHKDQQSCRNERLQLKSTPQLAHAQSWQCLLQLEWYKNKDKLKAITTKHNNKIPLLSLSTLL